MSNGFLPVSRQDMAERNIEQLDFVYIIGDAYVDHPSLDMPLSAGFLRRMAIRWESFRSRIGKMRTVSVF